MRLSCIDCDAGGLPKVFDEVSVDWRKGKNEIARALHLDLTHNQVRYARSLQKLVRPGTRWLDVGCGHSIVPEWAMPLADQAALVKRAAYLIGVDAADGIEAHPLLTHKIKGLGGRLPFRDETFDLVTANMVVEHVVDSDEFLRDIFRVLRRGGNFLFVTPNLLSPLIYAGRLIPDTAKNYIVEFLEQRKEEDIFPAYYRLNRRDQLEEAAAFAGLQIEQFEMIGSCGEFERLGLLSWIECLVLKGLEVSFHGKFQPDILGILQKPIAANLANPSRNSAAVPFQGAA